MMTRHREACRNLTEEPSGNGPGIAADYGRHPAGRLSVPSETLAQRGQPCDGNSYFRECMMNRTMKSLSLAAAGVAALGLAAVPALAQDKLKVGLLLTLSGPSAVLGQQARDGFQLALKEMGGKLGGRDVDVVVVDDEFKPDVAVTKVKGLVDRDKVDFVVGPIFSNVAVAVHKPIVDSKHLLHQPECRTVEPRGQELQPVLLRHLLPERPEPRGARQGRTGPGLQAGLSTRTQLSGRQGCARRVQAPLQGRDRRGILRSPQQSRLPVRARQDRLHEARRDLHLHAGRHGREPRQAISRGGPRRPHPIPLRLHGGRVDPAGRSRTRPSACSAVPTGRRTSTRRRTRSSSQPTKGPTARCPAPMRCMATTRRS